MQVTCGSDEGRGTWFFQNAGGKYDIGLHNPTPEMRIISIKTQEKRILLASRTPHVLTWQKSRNVQDCWQKHVHVSHSPILSPWFFHWIHTFVNHSSRFPRRMDPDLRKWLWPTPPLLRVLAPWPSATVAATRLHWEWVGASLREWPNCSAL